MYARGIAGEEVRWIALSKMVFRLVSNMGGFMVTTGNGQNVRGLDEGTVGIDAFLNSTFHLKKGCQWLMHRCSLNHEPLHA